MKPLNIIPITALLTLLLSGCATLFSESSQVVKFETNPAGAKIFINGDLVGTTPLEVEMEKDTFKNHYVRFQLDGYHSQQRRITKELNRIAIYNLTSWPSWGTDALTGAMIEYSPNNYYIELYPQNGFKSNTESNLATARVFATANQVAIKQEIAQGGGENLKALGKLYGLTPSQQIMFEQQLKENANTIVAINDATSFIDSLYGQAQKIN